MAPKAKAEVKAKAKAKAAAKSAVQFPFLDPEEEAEKSQPEEEDNDDEETERTQAVVKNEPASSIIPRNEKDRMDRSLKKMAKEGNPGPLAEYKSRVGKLAKRNFYWNTFVLDPKCSEFTVTETKAQKRTESEKIQPGWRTAEFVAEKQGWRPGVPNYEAKLKIAVKGLQSKEHDDQEMRDIGEMLYWYEHVEIESVSKRTRVLEGKQQVSNVAQEAYASAVGSFDGSNEASSSNPAEGGSNVENPVEVRNKVQVETWKTAALEQEKKAAVVDSAMSKLRSQAEQLIARFGHCEQKAEMSSTAKQLSKASKADLQDKLQKLSAANTAFQKTMSGLDHKTKEAATVYVSKAVAAILTATKARDALQKQLPSFKVVLASFD